MEIPKGFCQCGCGESTKLATQNSKKYGWVKGEPIRYVHGHASRYQSPEFIEKRAAALRHPEIQEEVKYCLCGCGEISPRAKESHPKRGILKGQYLRYIAGHHLRTTEHKEMLKEKNRGMERSPDSKRKDVLQRTGKEAIFSPYVPNRVIHFDEKKKRWVGNGIYSTKSGRNQKTHARMVWEYNNGPVPEGYHVHHINGRCERMEDDRIDNLMIVSAEWNSQHFVSLSKGFQVPEEKVTEIYREVFPTVPVDRVFREVVKKLLTITQD